MATGVKVTDNSAQVLKEITVKANIFLRKMADEMVKISTPKTPKDTGRLRADIVKSVLGLHGEIKWGKKYAAVQETKQFKNYTTPGTGPHYAENAVKAGIKKTPEVAKRAGLRT